MCAPFPEASLNPYFLIGLALAALFIWTVGTFFFWRISQGTKARKSGENVPPAYRLAEQWIFESQQKMEKLIQEAEQPLSLAQNELLELRLEASRLPQGVKNLKLVRESLNVGYQPAATGKNLLQLSDFYLNKEDFRDGGEGLVYLQTSLGEMPCLEDSTGGRALSDNQIKNLLARLAQTGGQNNAVAGGFIYFSDEGHFKSSQEKSEWVEAFRSRRLLAVDFKGLTALLMSLRLSKDVNRLVGVFQDGIQSTKALVGQSEKMGEALSALSADSLKVRTGMDGGHYDGFQKYSGKAG
jgi:hypothetical protein